MFIRNHEDILSGTEVFLQTERELCGSFRATQWERKRHLSIKREQCGGGGQRDAFLLHCHPPLQ